MKEILLNNDIVNQQNLHNDDMYIINQLKPDYIKFYHGTSGQEHYKLLSYLSNLYNNSLILDIGTYLGLSSMALSNNKNNTVITFDINELNINKNYPSVKDVKNIVYMVENILDNKAKFYDMVKKSNIIIMDVDPHDGVQEPLFMDVFKEAGFEGILILDDINLNKSMNDWWNSISYEKYDISKYGHWSGTGLVNFNKNTRLILE